MYGRCVGQWICKVVLGSLVWSGPGPFLLDRRLDSPVPDEISGTGTGTARDRLDRSGPGPDPVQTVPGGTFIPGRVDAVRGSRGGGRVVRSWGGVVVVVGEGGHVTGVMHVTWPPLAAAAAAARRGRWHGEGG